MFDWASLVERIRDDVKASLDAWTNVLLESIGSRLSYAYAKGSALKPWNSPIDYVPIISDVDIHIMLSDNKGLSLESEDAFSDAMRISQNYEDQFTEMRPDHLHIPRSQLMLIKRLSEILDYVPSRVEDVTMLIGECSEPAFPTIEQIRMIDLQNLLSLSDFLNRTPDRVIDRTGLDFWTIIREMTWRVSQSPVRLLTQSADDPLEVWSWNRTKISNELRTHGYDEIADHYRDFYLAGWNLFLSGFTSSNDFRWATASGYYVLQKCYREARTGS
jgi:hypothetical protein